MSIIRYTTALRSILSTPPGSDGLSSPPEDHLHDKLALSSRYISSINRDSSTDDACPLEPAIATCSTSTYTTSFRKSHRPQFRPHIVSCQVSSFKVSLLYCVTSEFATKLACR